MRNLSSGPRGGEMARIDSNERRGRGVAGSLFVSFCLDTYSTSAFGRLETPWSQNDEKNYWPAASWTI